MEREFHPELIPRRGEWIAWGLTIVVGTVWLVLSLFAPNVPVTVWILFLFFLFAALSISLGNWVDRNTVLRLSAGHTQVQSDEGIIFRNGLRDVHLRWDQIQEVHVLPDRWGKRVQVIGRRRDQAARRHTSFTFRTLGEVTYQGELKGRMGFAQGEEILEHILERAGLREIDSQEDGRYYARPSRGTQV